MKNKFKVGQKVRCIEPADKLKAGQIYEVAAVMNDSYITVAKYGTYFPWRFEPAYINTAIIRNTRNGGFRTTLVGKNGEVMFVSEVYTTKAKAKQTLKLFPDFEVVDKTK